MDYRADILTQNRYQTLITYEVKPVVIMLHSVRYYGRHSA